MKKATHPRHAWEIALAAALNLFAFVLMASSNPSPMLLLCEGILILGTIGTWKIKPGTHLVQNHQMLDSRVSVAPISSRFEPVQPV